MYAHKHIYIYEKKKRGTTRDSKESTTRFTGVKGVKKIDDSTTGRKYMSSLLLPAPPNVIPRFPVFPPPPQRSSICETIAARMRYAFPRTRASYPRLISVLVAPSLAQTHAPVPLIPKLISRYGINNRVLSENANEARTKVNPSLAPKNRAVWSKYASLMRMFSLPLSIDQVSTPYNIVYLMLLRKFEPK